MSRFFNFFSKELVHTSKIQTKSGLHLRPCALLAQKANEFQSKLTLGANGKNADAKKLNALLALGLEFEDEYTLRAKGNDAKNAIKTLVHLLDSFKDKKEMTKLSQSHREYKGSSLKGEAIHAGIATAKYFFYTQDLQNKNDEDFKAAISRAEGELKNIKSDIFEAQLAILKSIEAKSFKEFEQIIDRYINEMQSGANSSKADDYRDINNRVLKSFSKPKIPDEHFILFGDSLLPSDIEHLSHSKIVGVALKDISPRSHVAMLLRSLDIPTLKVDFQREILQDIVIIDAESEILVVNPESEDIKIAKVAMQKSALAKEGALIKSNEYAVTKDKKTIKVLANVHDIVTAKDAKEFGGDGIGLLRSEFIFKEIQPTLEEQIQFYKEIFVLFDDVCVRTLDVGGDKKLPYITIEEEQNPFLGIRGIRLLQTHKEIIAEQLKAILIAADDKAIKVMFPMVATPKEFIEAKALAVALAKKENIKIDNVQFGIMIEIPSVLFALEEFDKVVDFYSIGTNDLAQYLFAIDRTHKTLQIDDTEGVIYKVITKIVSETTKPLSICGELASEPENIQHLIECGLTTLSVTPKMIPTIKEKIRDV